MNAAHQISNLLLATIVAFSFGGCGEGADEKRDRLERERQTAIDARRANALSAYPSAVDFKESFSWKPVEPLTIEIQDSFTQKPEQPYWLKTDNFDVQRISGKIYVVIPEAGGNWLFLTTDREHAAAIVSERNLRRTSPKLFIFRLSSLSPLRLELRGEITDSMSDYDGESVPIISVHAEEVEMRRFTGELVDFIALEDGLPESESNRER